jgi:hypothetical protein
VRFRQEKEGLATRLVRGGEKYSATRSTEVRTQESKRGFTLYVEELLGIPKQSKYQISKQMHISPDLLLYLSFDK